MREIETKARRHEQEPLESGPADFARLQAKLAEVNHDRRYLAFELGEKQIRVHAVSPGPLKTRAASGVKDFDILLSERTERAPIGAFVDIDDVGLTTAYLATAFARRLTGTVTCVDGGLSIMA